MVAKTDSAMTAESEIQPARRFFRVLVVAAGIGSSIIFVVAGVSFKLQMFGDGSIFSYAVAAQSAWSFHWHNISGRLFTYVFAYIRPEAYVAVTENARSGIFIYGLLFFSAPLLGLLATLLADRQAGRVIFRVRLSLDCMPLPVGVRRADGNVDGACHASGRRSPSASAPRPNLGGASRCVRWTAGACIHS